MTSNPVSLDPDVRRPIAEAILEKAEEIETPIRALCVAATHVHVLARVEWECVNAQVGRLKRHSSHAVRGVLPGTVWAARCNATSIRDDEHFASTVFYILKHDEDGAVIWSSKPEEVERFDDVRSRRAVD